MLKVLRLYLERRLDYVCDIAKFMNIERVFIVLIRAE